MLRIPSIKFASPAWLGVFALAALAAVAPGAHAQAAPKPETYLCPNASHLGIDCYLDAVAHLYTMCRQVKSIEIIEFGYEKSDEGVNGAKSEYCIDKHKQTMSKPYQAALREAGGNRKVRDLLNSLHERWLLALAKLKWVPGENDEQYKTRVAQPYVEFTEQVTIVRAELVPPKSKTAPAGAPAAKKTATAPEPAAKKTTN